MKKYLILLLIIFISNFIFAQKMDSLYFKAKYILPHDYSFNDVDVFGLSGITYSQKENLYYIIGDKPVIGKTPIFKADISYLDEDLKIEFKDVQFVIGDGKVEGESIKFHPQTNQRYISDERKTSSLIYSLNNGGETNEIVKCKHPYNNGIEGIAFIDMGEKLIYSIEENNDTNGFTPIFILDLKTNKTIEYQYTLDEIKNNKSQYFGITELLSLSDSTLLVIERCYVRKAKKNFVNVYLAEIPTDNSHEVKKVKLLTQFENAGRIDNIEGVTLSSTGKELIFISDNNKNPHQETQFIIMSLEP